MPTAAQILEGLAKALELQKLLDLQEREAAGRMLVEDLRAQFNSEYRLMEAELRCRGTAPKSTMQEYEDRRMQEIARWNGWKLDSSVQGA